MPGGHKDERPGRPRRMRWLLAQQPVKGRQQVAQRFAAAWLCCCAHVAALQACRPAPASNLAIRKGWQKKNQAELLAQFFRHLLLLDGRRLLKAFCLHVALNGCWIRI